MTARLQHGCELCRPKTNVIIFKMTWKYRAQMKRRNAKFPSVRLSLSPIQSLCWKQSPQRDAANTALHHRVHVLSDVWFPQDTTPRTEAHQFSLGFNLSYFFCKLPTRVFVWGEASVKDTTAALLVVFRGSLGINQSDHLIFTYWDFRHF